VSQTPALPPSKGRRNLPTSGCTRKSSVAELKIANVKIVRVMARTRRRRRWPDVVADLRVFSKVLA